jgi:hypothetical protein
MTPSARGQVTPDPISGWAIASPLLLIAIAALSGLAWLAVTVARRTRATFAHATTPGLNSHQAADGTVWIEDPTGGHSLAGSADPAQQNWTLDAVQVAHGRLTRIQPSEDPR